MAYPIVSRFGRISADLAIRLFGISPWHRRIHSPKRPPKRRILRCARAVLGMHDERYENQATLNDESLALPLVFTLAEAMGLSTAPLQDPFARGEYARRSVAIFSVACAPA